MGQTKRSTLNRNPQRGNYDRAVIYPILDSTFLCHVGYVVDGEARVLPTAFVRIDDAVFVHGHLRNQMLRALLKGQMASVAVTQVDGLVLARSGFHHSVNYRSAVVFGRAAEISGKEKNEVLNALINHMVPGRPEKIRPSTAQELNATLVVKIPIEEASAKTRSGPPVDLESDYDLDIWAGVVNFKTVVSGIDDCPRLHSSTSMPKHIREFEKLLALHPQ